MTKSKALFLAWTNWTGAIECMNSGTVWPAIRLRQEAKRAYEVLRCKNVESGHKVAIVFSNTAAFPIWLMACLEIGANPVLLGIGTKLAELRLLVKQVGIHWAIHNLKDSASNLSKLRDGKRLGNFGGEYGWLFSLSRAKSTMSIEEGALLHPTS